jgi:hypothetical protein
MRITIALCLFATSLFSQERATITGTVLDATRAGVEGAAIKVFSEATGETRVTTTDGSGTYRIGGLMLGTYRLTVERSGFNRVEVNGLRLRAGETRTLDPELQIASQAEAVTVTDTAVALNQTSSTIGKVISGKELSTIPVNGRDYGAFLTLAPGAINTGDGSLRAVRIGGRTKDDNNITFDGVDSTSIREGPGYLVALRTVISSDSIAEFKVDSQLYTAESGFNMGAQVQFVSKSGTNSWHGGLFEYLRNDKFDARRFVDAGKPPFRMNQFGGNLGGPLVRNRTFFFVNYEGLRQVLSQTFVGFVPSESFKQRTLLLSPALAPLLNAYPAGERPTAQADILQMTYVGKQNWTENTGMFRVDHRFTEKLSGYLRYNGSTGEISSPLSIFANNRRAESMGAHNAVAQFQAILSPTTLNEFKLGLNRAAQFRPIVGAVPEAVTVPGLTTIPGNGGANDPGNTYSVINNFSTVKGRHTWKAGVEIRRIQINLSVPASSTVSYVSLAQFQLNRADTVGRLNELGTRGARSTVYMGYLQDEWKIKPNLTANLGLRYEFYKPFTEVYGRARVFDLDDCRGYCPPGTQFYSPDFNNADPRISLVWSPLRLKNRTTIRVGGGFYHQFGQLDDFIAPAENTTTRINITARDLPGLAYPIDQFVAGGQAVGDTPRAMAHLRRRDMVAYQYGLTINQSLPLAFELQTGYSASLGRHLMDRRHVNVIDLRTGQRPLPEFGTIDRKGSDGVSNFHALQVSLNRRFTRGWLWGTQYMWSKSIDDSVAGANESQLALNASCRRCDRARSQFDVRHTLTLSSTYELPFGRGKSFVNEGFAAAILSDWSMSGIFAARTGRPVNVILTRSSGDIPDGNTRTQQRPDLVPGVPVVPDNQTADNWININAFRAPAPGTFGNLGRNVLSGPGLVQMDVTLARSFRLREGLNLTFRAEAFNLFNRAQYGQPQNNLSSRSDFGRVVTPLNAGATGTGTARQLQFMLRLSF